MVPKRPKIADIIPMPEQREIIAAKVDKPDISYEALGKRFGWGKRQMEKLCEYRLPQLRAHDDVKELLATNEIIAAMTEKRIVEKLVDPEEKISLSELNNLRNDVLKQNNLMTGQATDRVELRYQGINVHVLRKEDFVKEQHA
jgi:hypothetical protein